MIIKGHTEETLKALHSLQGLYDTIIVAVDDREDSDEVFQAIQFYPNMIAYRQNWEQMGTRYNNARQDVLNRVPSNYDFVGWSDSDEILKSDPYIIRKWLYQNNPKDAVNFNVKYLYSVGGYEAGESEARPKIWKNGTRYWERPCHEHPFPIQGPDLYIYTNFTFDHIKEDTSDYAADHCIKLMQEEIDNGMIDWLFFQAREFMIKGDIESAKARLKKYIVIGGTLHLEAAIIKLANLFLDDNDYKGLLDILSDPMLPKHPKIIEYKERVSHQIK